MKKYFEKEITMNPAGEYLKWIKCKAAYQLKNWGNHLRIGYMSLVANTTFGRYNVLGSHCFLINSSLGDFSYINSYSYVLHASIGRYCSVGPNVKIAPGKHPTSTFVSTHPVTFNNQGNLLKNYCTENNFKNYQQVTIGNDVWIGANSIIVDGVTIADGAVIAANSVMVKDAGPYEIWGGNPARFIKKRFDEEQIAYLLKTEWWNKSEDWIQTNISKFWNIDKFTSPEELVTAEELVDDVA